MTTKNVIKKSSLNPTSLIIGGAGFLGYHLSEALLAKNSRVVVIDNVDPTQNLLVNKLLPNPKFALINGDINKGIPTGIESVDYVFYLTNLEDYYEQKDTVNLNTLLTSALGTKNVLEFAKKSEAKLLLASTVDIYKGVVSPIDLEHYFGNYPIDEQKFSLIEAKRFSEALAWEFYKRNKIDVRIARLPDLYGPGMSFDNSGTLGFLTKNLLENHNLSIKGDGAKKEYYLYVTDAVAGILKATFSESTSGKIFSLVPKEPHSILEIAYVLKNLCNTMVNLSFSEADAGYSNEDAYVPDRSTLSEINWQETVNLKDGLVKTLRSFSYEPNDRSFKPSKLIEDKRIVKENASKMHGRDSITSLFDDTDKEATSKPVEDNTFTSSHFDPIRYAKPTFNRKEEKKGKISQLFKKNEEYTKQIKNHSKLFFRLISLITVLFLFVLVFIGIPLGQTYFYVKKGADQMESAKYNVLSLNLSQSQLDADYAFKNFRKARSSLDRVSWAFKLTGKGALFNNAQNFLSGAEHLSKTMYFSSKGAEPYLLVWTSLKPNTESVLEEDTFNSSAGNFSSALENLRLAETAFRDNPLNSKNPYVEEKIANITSYAEYIELMQSFSSSINNLLGVGEKKSYLILLQNSNEIRPTGGFIGSYAILDVEQGKIVNLSIDDVYNPDGQLDVRDIKVEVPQPIKELLNEDRLHIRNANWDPDFSLSAENIKDLFFKLDGREFDGVIAVDLHLVEKILEVTGPIYLTAYDEEILSSNLYERTQFHSEFNYQTGSDQKRSFLTVLGGKLLETIFAMNQEQLPKLGSSMKSSLDSKHALIYVPDTPIASFLAEKGWDGSVRKAEHDFLYVINSNLGGTKANYYVKNEMYYNIFSATRDGMLRASLELKYNHTGQDFSWPGGPYTNYLRVMTKAGTKLTGAKLVIDDGTPIDIFNSVIETSYDRRFNFFEFPFVLDPQQTASVILEYDLPQEITVSKDTYTYSLVWQKQAGTSEDLFKFNFNSPFGKRIENTIPRVETYNNSVLFEGFLNEDKTFVVYMD